MDDLDRKGIHLKDIRKKDIGLLKYPQNIQQDRSYPGLTKPNKFKRPEAISVCFSSNNESNNRNQRNF
jgi:hypothetical protein